MNIFKIVWKRKTNTKKEEGIWWGSRDLERNRLVKRKRKEKAGNGICWLSSYALLPDFPCSPKQCFNLVNVIVSMCFHFFPVGLYFLLCFCILFSWFYDWRLFVLWMVTGLIYSSSVLEAFTYYLSSWALSLFIEKC